MVNLENMEVLLFDSRDDRLLLLEEILTRVGCKVSAVMQADECVAKVRPGKYGLVIFDHAVPGLDASAFAAQVETIDRSLPIAMMVTLPSRFYEDKYGCSGIDFLIFEPFGYEEVLYLAEEAFHYSQALRKASWEKPDQ